jgi:Family of unknown function (DUF6152)
MELPMPKIIVISIAALVALACSGPARAHHSGSMYATTPVWIQGTVIRFEDINPHTIITLEGQTADGQVRRWSVEGRGRAQLERMGLTDTVPQMGDAVTFCAFPYKSVDDLSRMFPGVDFSSRRATSGTDGSAQFLAGHIMVTSDGEKQLWEPHGLISECIRTSDDDRQSWLDFLNSETSARQAWCEQRRYTLVQSAAPLKELIDEINASLESPCE